MKTMILILALMLPIVSLAAEGDNFGQVDQQKRELLSNSEDNLGFITPIGIGREVSLLKAEMAAVKGNIESLKIQINAQAGLINKISQNSGTQVFTGDVAAVTISGLVILVIALMWGGFYYRKAILTERATQVLAHTTSEEEALELAKKEHEGVKKIIQKAIDK